MGGRSRHLLSSVRRAFARSTRKPITGLIINDNIAPPEQLKQLATDDREEENCGEKKQKQKQKQKKLSLEDQAAIMIQSFFRGHLARRAFRALRSLVKLQALVRGACVRRQSRMAAHCIHALVRLHLRVRSRQLMAGNGRSEPFSA